MTARDLSDKQAAALGMLIEAKEHPETDTGRTTSGESFYDREVHVARINGRTANALARRHLVRFGEFDRDEGWEIVLI